MPPKKLLVTCALPYANGAIHIGHMVEYVQGDIWVRYWKMRGRDTVFFCADDTHGTPIMIRAKSEGRTPEALIAAMWREHVADFAAFGVEFDHYQSTNSEENRELTLEIYEALKAGGHLETREIEQAWCPNDKMFLPDRYVRGRCPNCGAEDQYGDACEACSKTYDASELVAPRCSQCGASPEWRASEHVFFRLGTFTDRLREWLDGGRTQDEVRNKLEEWFRSGLQDWDISRDAPYFGFEIPDLPGKYFYVWVDAPVGYMAATLDWCRMNGADFDSYWRRGDEAEVVHFIGKDILYFHTLFWPATLMGSGFRPPSRVWVHGFLTVDGEKMSKARGTFINAGTFARHVPPEYLRYYYAAKLNSRVEDIDLSFEDFIARLNSDLVGKIANIPSRTLKILHKSCGGRLGTLDDEGRRLVDAVRARADEVASFYEGREFARAVRLICELAADVNLYVQTKEPWALAKEDPPRAAAVCTAALNAFKVVATLLRPILPGFTAKVARMLDVAELSWALLDETLEERPVREYERLADRLAPNRIEALLEASRESLAG